jgi:hypothetical protein
VSSGASVGVREGGEEEDMVDDAKVIGVTWALKNYHKNIYLHR